MYTVQYIGTYSLMNLFFNISCDVKKDKKEEIINP